MKWSIKRMHYALSSLIIGTSNWHCDVNVQSFNTSTWIPQSLCKQSNSHKQFASPRKGHNPSSLLDCFPLARVSYYSFIPWVIADTKRNKYHSTVINLSNLWAEFYVHWLIQINISSFHPGTIKRSQWSAFAQASQQKKEKTQIKLD